MSIGSLRILFPALLSGAIVASGLLLTSCNFPREELVAPAQPSAAIPVLLSPVRISGPGSSPLAVSDYGADSVCLIDRASLEPTSCFTIAGKPLGIAATADRIFVGNETAHRVEAYDRSGVRIADLPGTYSIPSSLAVDELAGLLFVLDTGTRTISVLTYAGYPVRTLSGDAAGDGKLVNPVALTVDPARQEILVSDYGDPALSYPARVRIYTYDGTFVAAISGNSGGFSRPQGLFVDNGHIFVADGMVGKVLLFTRLTSTATATAGSLGTFGGGPGQLMLPLDVLVDPASKDVYVTNNRAGRIERFEKGGIIP